MKAVYIYIHGNHTTVRDFPCKKYSNSDDDLVRVMFFYKSHSTLHHWKSHFLIQSGEVESEVEPISCWIYMAEKPTKKEEETDEEGKHIKEFSKEGKHMN